jgi:hypothetical protein
MQATERKTLSIDELIQSTADYNPRKISKEELEPKYCDVIVQRWEKLTGQKAVLVG